MEDMGIILKSLHMSFPFPVFFLSNPYFFDPLCPNPRSFPMLMSSVLPFALSTATSSHFLA